MTTTGINSLSSSNGNAVMGTRAATMGDNQFLTLLTTQLRNQTPLEPVDNESFMNQMASYTTMQEQRDLNGNLLKLLDYQGVLARMQGLSQGSALLGKEVSYAGEGGTEARGKVESVFVADSGDVKLKLEGGKEIDLRAVLGIRDLANPSSNGGNTTNTNTSNGGANNNASNTNGGSSTNGGSTSTGGTNGSTTTGGTGTGTGTTGSGSNPTAAVAEAVDAVQNVAGSFAGN
jgi:flagellar basal-body rod modification protein FlgD